MTAGEQAKSAVAAAPANGTSSAHGPGATGAPTTTAAPAATTASAAAEPTAVAATTTAATTISATTTVAASTAAVSEPAGPRATARTKAERPDNETATTRTTTTAEMGCHAKCSMGGAGGTCSSQIQRAAFTDFLGDVGSCTKARELVVAQCPSCAGCRPKGAGCGLLEPITTPAPAGVAPCDVGCFLGGQLATCGARMKWSSIHTFAGRPDACGAAEGLVRRQCSACGECKAEAFACEDDDTRREAARAASGAPSFDCAAGLARWQDGWSEKKKAWCCKHEQRGCQSTTTSMIPFDCKAGLAKAATGWSDSKKDWCCRHRSVGCGDSRIHVLAKFDGDRKQVAGLLPVGPREALVAGVALACLGAFASAIVMYRRRPLAPLPRQLSALSARSYSGLPEALAFLAEEDADGIDAA